MENLRISNVFGIKPTTNHTAAGLDFYIPNLKNVNAITERDKIETILEAFSKSYGISREKMNQLMDDITLLVASTKGVEYVEFNELNLLQLYLILQNWNIGLDHENYTYEGVEYFVDNILIWDDEKKIPGIQVEAFDSIKVNAGIKVCLDPGYVGIFFNKSGRASAGWDVRACVIDEDYAGYVHLNVAFTSEFNEKSRLFCGDKLTQMIIWKISHTEITEIPDDEYQKLMANSQRGDSAFGSSNEKH